MLYGSKSGRYNESSEELKIFRYLNAKVEGAQPASEEQHECEETDKAVGEAAARL